MKVLKSFLILSIAILGFSFVNVEARSFSEDGNTTQQQIEKQVFKKIVYMPDYGVFDNIKFSVEGDTVTLQGKVYNAIIRQRAEKQILKIDGVENVINNIEILPPSSFDNRIRRQTVRSFARTGGIYRYLQGPNPSMRIIVERGRLTLEGYVTNNGDSKLANILAQGIPGVFSVTNNLIVTKEKLY
jgi:hyperosmotically inducible protein